MTEKKRPRVGIGVLVLQDNKVLLGKRNGEPKDESPDGTWTLTGGKLELGESFENCAKREAIEECGIKINKLKLISISNASDYNKNHYVTIVFLCDDFEGEPKVTEPHKITEWGWFPLNELPEPMFLPSLRAINNYLKNIIYRGD
jgi:8-oxo-dGTP diphosphatase